MKKSRCVIDLMNSQSSISGLFDKSHVIITFSNKSNARESSVSEYIQEHWNKTVQKNPLMFSGDLLSVVNNNSNPEYIKLDTILTKYDDYYITRTKEFQQEFPNQKSTNVLSTGCVSITSDNYVVLGKRSLQLSVSPGKITIVSGMADNEDIIKNNQVDVFGCITREIKEEIGVNSNEIKELICMGLIEKPRNQGIFIPFFGSFNIPFSKITERENDGELIELFKIKNSEKEIIKVLEDSTKLSSVAISSLKIYLDLFSILNNK